MKKIPKAYLYAVSAILLWSTVAVAFKTALAYIDFIQLLFISSLTSTIVLFIVLIAQRRVKNLFTFSAKQYLHSIVLGLLNPFAYYLILLKAYSILPAQLAQPLNYTWPVILVLLSVPLLKQKLYTKNLIAIFISFLGVFIISMRDNFSNFHIDQPFGVLLASSSAIIWALFWIFNVKDKRAEVEKLSLSFFFSLFFSGIVLLSFSEIKMPPINGLLAAIYVGLFEMGITFILWMKAMSIAERSDKISNLVYLSPFLSLIWINVFLNESVFYSTIIGLIFIVAGIFVQQFIKN